MHLASVCMACNPCDCLAPGHVSACLVGRLTPMLDQAAVTRVSLVSESMFSEYVPSRQDRSVGRGRFGVSSRRCLAMQVWFMSEHCGRAERDHPSLGRTARALSRICGPATGVRVGTRSVEFRRESARPRQTVVAVSTLPEGLRSAIRIWDEGGPLLTGRAVTVRVPKSFIRPKVVSA